MTGTNNGARPAAENPDPGREWRRAQLLGQRRRAAFERRRRGFTVRSAATLPIPSALLVAPRRATGPPGDPQPEGARDESRGGESRGVESADGGHAEGSPSPRRRPGGAPSEG